MGRRGGHADRRVLLRRRHRHVRRRHLAKEKGRAGLSGLRSVRDLIDLEVSLRFTLNTLIRKATW